MAPSLGDDRVLGGDVGVHDPSSIVREGDRYYLFGTGWGLRSLVSDDLTTWRRQRPVFERGAGPEWVADHVPEFRGHYWAPDVVRVGDRYRVYYSCSRFGKQTSAIGLASSKSLDPESPDYGWRDDGLVVASEPGEPYNAIDPSVVVDEQGRHWMAFGSYWRGLFLMELDPATGLALASDGEKHRLAHAEMIEAATLVRRGDWWYLFVNHGLCCRGVESTYEILVGRSRDIAGPYLDRDGRELLEGGGTTVLESEGERIGPGHVAALAESPDERFGFHYYDAADRGRSKLGLARWQWSDDGWPTAVDTQIAAPSTFGRERRRPR